MAQKGNFVTGSSAVSVTLHSMSRADDVGLRALHGLASLIVDMDCRIIGGHMVRLLQAVYSAAEQSPRVTADADAGISTRLAISGDVHDALISAGFVAEKGNRYRRRIDSRSRDMAENDGEVAESDAVVDLLVPGPVPSRRMTHGERAFDSAGGLRLALEKTPLVMKVEPNLLDGDVLSGTVAVPDVESAVVLKLLAWASRKSQRDLDDLVSLMELVAVRREFHVETWCLDQPAHVRMGERGDAAQIAETIRRLPAARRPARLAALLERFVAQKSSC